MNQRFQYKTVVLNVSSSRVLTGRLTELDETLQRLGEEGWKLVSVWPLAAESKKHYAIHYFVKQLDDVFV